MMKVMIIDDEAPARDLIRHCLQSYPDIEIVGEADNGFAAMKLIRELNPQLIFLDVQMPKLTGFEMLELMEHPPEIIFSTRFTQSSQSLVLSEYSSTIGSLFFILYSLNS